MCKARTPQTKGKVERTIGFVEHNFWPGVTFADIDDLNRQALAWCERINRAPILNRRHEGDRGTDFEFGMESPRTVKIAGRIIAA